MAAARVSASRAALPLLLLALLACVLCCAGDPSPSRVLFGDRWLPSSTDWRRRSSRRFRPAPHVPRVRCNRACLLERAKARTACTVRPRDAGRRCGDELVRYSYVSATNSCVPFRYGGCRGNANNFLSFKQCSDRCKTSGEKRRGSPTRHRSPRGDSRVIFGGIAPRRGGRDRGGTLSNRFGGRGKPPGRARGPIIFPGPASADRRPPPPPPPPPKKSRAACFRPARQPGRPCGDAAVRYSYIRATNSCVPFEHQGCGGSSNSFGTFSECRDLCKADAAAAGDGGSRRPPALQCRLPWRAGPCRGFGPMMRYFYNAKRNACEMALYSGCGGNTNRFFSRRTCERTCRVG